MMDDKGHEEHKASSSLFVVFVCVVVLFVAAGNARAELVFFGNGNTMSVKGHRTEGESLVLLLRSGGEIVCEPSVIVRIEPDEVPYPEPEASPRPAADDGTAPPIRLEPELDAYLQQVSAEQHVPAKLVRAVIQVESAYQANARSRKGAIGLMQLMPETARQYAVKNPYDPRANIEAGIKHLKSLLERFPLTLALAAYNAGEAAVQRFGGVPPYRETQDYVARIVKLFGRTSL
jgi:hypothetical protein